MAILNSGGNHFSQQRCAASDLINFILRNVEFDLQLELQILQGFDLGHVLLLLYLSPLQPIQSSLPCCHCGNSHLVVLNLPLHCFDCIQLDFSLASFCIICIYLRECQLDLAVAVRNSLPNDPIIVPPLLLISQLFRGLQGIGLGFARGSKQQSSISSLFIITVVFSLYRTSCLPSFFFFHSGTWVGIHLYLSHDAVAEQLLDLESYALGDVVDVGEGVPSACTVPDRGILKGLANDRRCLSHVG